MGIGRPFRRIDLRHAEGDLAELLDRIALEIRP
jgi:hypothetical protein